MSWLQSFFCGVLCAALGAVATGYTANECITWYRVSNREGGGGYMVAFFGLVGLVLGFIIGMAASCLSGGTFLKQLGTGLVLVIGLEVLGYAIARAGGEVPPTISGETLNLLIELRCPKSWTATNAIKAGDRGLRLSSVNSANLQTSTSHGDVHWK